MSVNLGFVLKFCSQCSRGRLVCEGEGTLPSPCPAGQIYYNCSADPQNLFDFICPKTCKNRALPCPYLQCTSGTFFKNRNQFGFKLICFCQLDDSAFSCLSVSSFKAPARLQREANISLEVCYLKRPLGIFRFFERANNLLRCFYSHANDKSSNKFQHRPHSVCGTKIRFGSWTPWWSCRNHKKIVRFSTWGFRHQRGREPILERPPVDILSKQLYYICFIRVLDGGRWVTVGC